MSKVVDAEDLAVELSKAVKDYTDDVQKAIDKKVSSTATKVKREIKRNSPRDTGEYADSWSRKTNRKGGSTEVTIYNKEKPQLTHLLEFGHAKVNGGRVSEIPHIRPAYDKFVPQMEKDIEKIIKSGG
ncbi:MAG: HK97 gp10 family phage protein [Petrotogales bacterium]